MKRIATLLLALLSTPTWAAEYDLIMMQRNSVDTGQLTRLVARPAGGADGVLGYNGTTQLPQFLTIGSGLSVSGAVLSATGGSGSVSWASVTGKPTFAPVATSGLYSDLTGTPAIPAAQVQTDWNATTGLGVLLNKPATFAPAAHTQAFSTITATPTTLAGYGITDGLTAAALTPYATSAALTTGLAAKFNTPTGTTAQYVRGDGTLATLPVVAARAISYPARALNTVFQPSATRDADVRYSVQLVVTASLTSGQQGDVILEVASDAAFTTNVQTASIAGLGQTYSLAVAIQGVQPQTGVVTAIVPAGYYVRLRTVNVTGTPAFSVRAGQETLL